MEKILITAASDAQLRTFGETILALDPDELNRATTRAQLLAVIGAAWQQDHISIPDAPAPQQDGQAAPAVPVADVVFPDINDDGPLTQFKIISTNMPGGNVPASPILNGRLAVMQRNMLINAPYGYYLLLRNANVGEPYEVENGPGKPPTVMFTEVTNYPLSDVVLPPQAEIDAWHARRGPKLLAA